MTRPALNGQLRAIGLALIEEDEHRQRIALEFAGPSPSPMGFMLERAELESMGSDGRPHGRRSKNAIPCRDDGWIWRQTGRDFAPDYSARFEAILTEREKRVLMLGARVSATDAASELGITVRQWQRMTTRIAARVRRGK